MYLLSEINICIGDMMGIKGRQFIKVAEELERKYKSEPYQRTAVGRYYYGCFLTARRYYEKKNNRRLGKKDAHNKLINYFKDSKNPIENKMGKRLYNMRKYRNNADYGYRFEKKNLKKVKNNSRVFFKYFRKL